MAAPNNLAEGQGGRDVVCAEMDRVGRFLAKGESVLTQFSDSVAEFQGTAHCVRNLSDTVEKLQNELRALKRKSSDNSDTVVKQSRTGNNVQQPEVNLNLRNAEVNDEISSVSSDDDNCDEVDEFMSPEVILERDEDDNLLSELAGFYEEESALGENVSSGLATVVNKALRALPATIKKGMEKSRQLKDQYKRPGNLENLQVPRIDNFLWRQLKRETRTADVMMQNAVQQHCAAIVPVARAMDFLHSNPNCQGEELKVFITDTFKILCDNVTGANHGRRDRVKKELEYKFKSLCTAEHPISATKLFGDNLKDESKALDDTKMIKMTVSAVKPSTAGSSKNDFLEKRWGATAPKSAHFPQSRTGNSYNKTGKRNGPMQNYQRQPPKPFGQRSEGRKFTKAYKNQ